MKFHGLSYGAWVTVLLAFGAVVLNIGMLRGDGSLDNYLELQRSRELLAKTVHNLEEENKSLGEEITKLNKSKNYARKVLRDKYHVTDKDENIIFFGDEGQ